MNSRRINVYTHGTPTGAGETFWLFDGEIVQTVFGNFDRDQSKSKKIIVDYSQSISAES